MKKRIIYLSSFILIALGVGIFIDQAFFKPTEINNFIATKVYSSPANKAFTDDNFYKCVIDEYNKDHSTKLPYTTNLSDEQLKTVFDLNCAGKNVKSTKGLERLTSLSWLIVSDNQLTNLDVSKNTALDRLHVVGNQLTNLDVSKNVTLEQLYVDNNQLTNIDVSGATALKYLSINNNQLTSLDVSKNTVLKKIDAKNNQLTNLDASGATALTSLDARNNQLINLDVSGAASLTSLNVNYNQLTNLDVSGAPALTSLDARNNQLINLDVSKNTALTSLNVYSNQLTNIDASGATSLTSLAADYNQLTNLDVSGATALTSLNVYSNQLTNIDVSNNAALTYLDAYGNKLTNIDVSKNTALTYLGVYYNQLTSIDVSKNTALTVMSVAGNKLTNLDVSKNTALTSLSASYNQLTSIDVSKNTALTSLSVDRNELTSLDVSRNIALTYLNAGSNQLTSLDVSKNTALIELHVDNNKLTSIDAGNNTALTKLMVNDNQLTNIDVSGATALAWLHVNRNHLTNIDVRKNTALTSLNVGSNRLTSIDLSRNTALEGLDVYWNQLTSIDVSKNTALAYFDVKNNELTNIDVSNNTALTHLDVGANKLTNIDVSNNTALKYFDVKNNELTNLDVSKNTALIELYADANKLASIDVSGGTSLKKLNVINNPFATKLIIYKGNINIGNYNKFVKLPEGKNSTLIKANSDSKNVIIDGSSINIDKIGNYVVTVDYKHNIGTNYNGYTGTYNIKVVEITSDKYKIDEDKEYIYTGTDVDKNTILKNIKLDSECSKVIEDNKLIIKYGDEVLKTFKIVNVSSTKYDLSKEYIFDNNFSIDNIKVVNGTGEVNNNQLLIKYEDVVLNKYNLVSYNSTKYDMSKDSIKVLDNNIEEFINNIKCINCNIKIFDGNEYKVNGDFGDNDKLRILYGNEVLKEYNLTYGVSGISLVNKKVKLNLDTKNSIKLEYTISPKNSDNKEVTWKSSNTDVVTIDNNGVITAKGYGDAVITVTTVDGNYSDTCNVNVSEFITYTITYKDGDNSYTEDYEEGDSVTWKSDITKKGYTLVGWKYNDKEYKLSDKFTMINEDITVTSIWNVNKYTITYEVNGGNINSKTKEVTYDSKYGTLEMPSKKGYSFKGWYKDNGFIDIVDEDTIVSDDKDHTLYAKWEINSYKLTINDGVNTNEYTLKYNDEKEIVIPERKDYSFVRWNITGTDSTINNNVFKMGTEDSTLVAEWKLVIPEIKNYKINNKYITGIKINTNVSDIDLGLDSIYTIKITNKNNELKTKGLVCTGDIVSIYLNDNLVISYVVVVKGDVTGTGNSSVSDVAKLYQYLKGKIDMEEHYVLAGNVVDTDNEIKIGDVAKLYQFIKGKISSL